MCAHVMSEIRLGGRGGRVALGDVTYASSGHFHFPGLVDRHVDKREVCASDQSDGESYFSR